MKHWKGITSSDLSQGVCPSWKTDQDLRESVTTTDLVYLPRITGILKLKDYEAYNRGKPVCPKVESS